MDVGGHIGAEGERAQKEVALPLRELPVNENLPYFMFSLDLDAVSSLCPNCHIILVEAASSSRKDLSQAMLTGKNMGASQLSDSWSIVSGTPTGEALVRTTIPNCSDGRSITVVAAPKSNPPEWFTLTNPCCV